MSVEISVWNSILILNTQSRWAGATVQIMKASALTNGKTFLGAYMGLPFFVSLRCLQHVYTLKTQDNRGKQVDMNDSRAISTSQSRAPLAWDWSELRPSAIAGPLLGESKFPLGNFWLVSVTQVQNQFSKWKYIQILTFMTKHFAAGWSFHCSGFTNQHFGSSVWQKKNKR